MKRFILVLIAVLVLVAISIGIQTVNAQNSPMYPSECVAKSAYGTNSAIAACYKGTGYVRVWLVCHPKYQFTTYYRYGPWVPSGGSESWASCYAGDILQSYGSLRK